MTVTCWAVVPLDTGTWTVCVGTAYLWLTLGWTVHSMVRGLGAIIGMLMWDDQTLQERLCM